MAASFTARHVSTAPLSHKRSSNTNGPSRKPRLPDGACNFKNLSVGGADPPRCGCQRFWDKSDYAKSQSGKQQRVVGLDQVGWCMCEHHACFHEILSTRDSRGRSVAESSTWRASSQLSRRADWSLASSAASQISHPDSQQNAQAAISSEDHPGGSLGVTGHEAPGNELMTQSGMPDTARGSLQDSSESSLQGLPPIPSQCILPADISSGSFTTHSQSFPSFFAHDSTKFVELLADNNNVTTPSQVGNILSSPLQWALYQQSGSAAGSSRSFVQSVTDIITPRPGSPDLSMINFDESVAVVESIVNPLASRGHQKLFPVSHSISQGTHTEHAMLNITAVAVRDSTEMSTTGPVQDDGPADVPSPDLRPHLQNILRHVSAHPRLSTRVDNHEQRLDLVENITSSFAGAQEVQEKFSLVDERIDELDSRVEDIEKSAALNEVGSFTKRHRRLRQIDDDDSMVSETSTDILAAAIDRSELSARLENIETRLNDFQALALPSWACPWQVEVVFLPFGSELRGIWSTTSSFPSQRSRHNSTAPDARMQTQYSNVTGGNTSLDHSRTEHSPWERVNQQSEIAHDWLLPRACTPGGKVEERLRSRGLIKMIEVRGPSARDVSVALHAAFHDLPFRSPLLVDGMASQVPDSLRHFHGLFESWIPLRKIHKDSRLRFLDPSEMVTPAMWNPAFLQNVCMKATGVRRLFLTHHESYVQISDDPSGHWTWQKLRVLPRIFPDTQSSTEVREADALETCWEWDERLDPPQSVHSSFFSQHSPLSIRQPQSQQSQSSQSGHSTSRASPALSTTPTSARPVSPLVERHRPLHARTTSMPIPLKIPPPQGKRRIASFEYERNGPTSPQSSPIRQVAALTLKRRRISRSPSRPRDTPRWSVGPPSPYCYDEPVEQKRGTTPFAYATPHSNAPYIDFRGQSVGPMAEQDHDEHGSTTDNISLMGKELRLEEFDSDRDQEQAPEDEPFEGLGDEMVDDDSDQERNALSQDEYDNASSELSSKPSEYPSTQPSAMYTGNRGSFHIHVDEQESYGGNRHTQQV